MKSIRKWNLAHGLALAALAAGLSTSVAQAQSSPCVAKISRPVQSQPDTKKTKKARKPQMHPAANDQAYDAARDR